MVRIEVEISVSVSGFSVDFGGQCHLLPDDENKKVITLFDSISTVICMAGLKLLW
jgi:hypothetical protein